MRAASEPLIVPLVRPEFIVAYLQQGCAESASCRIADRAPRRSQPQRAHFNSYNTFYCIRCDAANLMNVALIRNNLMNAALIRRNGSWAVAQGTYVVYPWTLVVLGTIDVLAGGGSAVTAYLAALNGLKQDSPSSAVALA